MNHEVTGSTEYEPQGHWLHGIPFDHTQTQTSTKVNESMCCSDLFIYCIEYLGSSYYLQILCFTTCLYFQLYTDTFSRNIERMLRQHSSMWSLLETHARTLAVLSTEAGVSPPDLSALASHSSQRATTPTTSTKDGDDTTDDDVSKRNLTSNALVSQSGELA